MSTSSHRHPLSWQQLGIGRFMDQGERITNAGMLFRLPDGMTAEHLRRRLEGVVRREEVLRITELSFDQGGHATYAPEVELPFRTQRVDTPQELQAVAAELSCHAFDLSGGPLWKMVVIDHPDELGRKVHSACAVFNHLISDARSLHVMRSDLRSELSSSASAARGRYRDWVTIQRTQFPMGTPEIRTEAAEFWHSYLDGTPPDRGTILPFWRPGRLSGFSYLIHSELPVSKATLMAAAGRVRSSPFLLFLAVVSATIAEVAGVDDITFRLNTNGRTAEFLDTLGLFVDIAPVRVRHKQLADLQNALDAATDGWLQALEFQATPWDYITEICPQTVTSSDYQVPQVLLNFIPYGFDPIPVDGTEEGPHPGEVEAFQLGVILWDEGNCLLDCEFDPERFPKGEVYDFLGLLGDRMRRLTAT